MKQTVSTIREKKIQHVPLTMLTSYDYPTAQLEDEAGVDIQLVGDSVGTTVLGYESVRQVTVEDMAHHLRAVVRGVKHSFILCDMPYQSYSTPNNACRTAQLFRENGADGVKIEGKTESLHQIHAVCRDGIEVCAHIGYTPQFHGDKASVQGKDEKSARELIDASFRLQDAGVFALVLEYIPEELARIISENLSIPTIGIGAGRYCDGQVLVIHDVLGYTDRIFRHVRAFGTMREQVRSGIRAYVAAVIQGDFPEKSHASSLTPDVLENIGVYVAEILHTN